MHSFNLPLSRRLDFGVDENAHAFLKAWDGRGQLHLTPDEFKALFELLSLNHKEIERELAELDTKEQA